MTVWICPFFGDSTCDGPFEAHHLIGKRKLKDTWSRREWERNPVRPIDQILGDRRNLIPLCQRHHELVTNGRIYVTADMLPAGFEDFAEELDLSWFTERFERSEG